MKILITGATGLIGKYLVRKLKEKGHEIVNFDQKKRENLMNFNGIQIKIS